MTQKEVYDEILRLGYDLSNLASFFQNDFEKLIEDRLVSRKVLESDLSSWEDSVYDLIQELKNLKHNGREVAAKAIDGEKW